MDIKELTNFIAIAENGSISRAARELHISQPPLTKAITTARNGTKCYTF